MEIKETHKKSLQLLNTNIFNEEKLKLLLTCCCNSLLNKKCTVNIQIQIATFFQIKTILATSNLFHSNSTQTKEVYYSILYILTEYTRHNRSQIDLIQFLLNECKLSESIAKTFGVYYQEHFKQIRKELLNIGSDLPCITDVKWKIDYMANVNGPIFRVFLKTEKYDEIERQSKSEYVEFSCTNDEFQDLLYRLKDALHHCEKLSIDAH